MMRTSWCDRKSAVLAILVSSPLAACGGHDATAPKNEPLAETCRVQLAPRRDALPAARPAPAAQATRPSRLVAHVDLRLASLAKELDAKIPQRLADERNKNIGVGGHLNYTVDRGPFSVSIAGDSLIVKTDVRSHAEACRGRSCYASCDPTGTATATVPLRLLPDYRFAPSRVTFDFSRGCTVKALMVKVDVTPMLKDALAPSLRRVEQEIDGKLPPMRPQAERLWAELGKSRSLPLGGCVVTNPRGLIEGPISGTPDALRVRFGVVAYPELRSRCGEAAPAPGPLPPLAQDPKLPADDELLLALVSPLAAAASGLEGTNPFDAGGARARIARATAVPFGPLAQLDLGLRGEACGDLGVRSAFGWAEDGRSIKLAGPAFADGERERATGLAADTLVSSLGQVRFSPPVAPETLKELVPSIVSSMSDPTVDVSAKIDAVKPLDVTLRGDDLAATVLVRGSVELKQR